MSDSRSGLLHRPTGHVFRVDGKRGAVWYAKYRLPSGRQVQRRLGPAAPERGRPPSGHFTRRLAEDWLRTTLEEARRGTLPGMVLGPLGVVACGSTSHHPPSAGAPADTGLRSVAGYGDYDECRSGCVGAVPAGLRRPLPLARLRTGEACPITRAFAATADFYRPLGRGPVYPAITTSRGAVHLPSRASHGVFAGSAWSGFKVLWVAQPSYQGPVLIRGRRLDRPGAVGFGLGIVPNDELQLPPGDRAGAPPSPRGWRNWPSTSRMRSPGCYAWQIDGTGFSRIVVARVG